MTPQHTHTETETGHSQVIYKATSDVVALGAAIKSYLNASQVNGRLQNVGT